MIKDITSTQNSTYKLIKSLKTKKERVKNRMYTVEGIKSVSDALSAGAEVLYIAVSDKLQADIRFNEIYRIPDKLFSTLCDTDTPQGVIAVIKMPEKKAFEPCDSLYLYCDRVSDPGNMGTIIRICDSVGCSLLLSPECADIYSPKTVRASMGSFFHTNIVENVTYDDLKFTKKQGYTLLSGALCENTVDYREKIYSGKTIIVVGNEANGVSEEILELSDLTVKIPIYGEAESLNVAVASALLLYKAKEMQGE